MSSERFEDARKFIKEHESEVDPLLDAEGKKVLDHTETASSASEISSDIDTLLEKFETKIFVYENNEADPRAQRVLVEASQPATFKIVNALIGVGALQGDKRCREITLLTDNIAGKYFSDQEHSYSERGLVRTGSGSILRDIPGPFDVALAMEDTENSPVSLLLYGAKSVFQAKRFYFMLPGFVGESTKMRFTADEIKNADELDGLIVGDDLAKRLVATTLHVPIEKIIVAGSPLLDGLDPEKGLVHRQAGREKAGIPLNAAVALFLGDRSQDYRAFGGDPDLNVKTFVRTLEGMTEAAHLHPDKQFALIVRPHPRAVDEQLLSLVGETPPNLAIVQNGALSFDEATYASDIICCNITSTETFLARYRGRTAGISMYQEKGLGGEIAHKIYNQTGLDMLRETKGISFISSAHDLAQQISDIDPTHPETPPVFSRNSTKKVVDVILAQQT